MKMASSIEDKEFLLKLDKALESSTTKTIMRFMQDFGRITSIMEREDSITFSRKPLKEQ